MESMLLPIEVSPAAAVGLIVLSYFTSTLTAAAGIGGGIVLISVMASFLPPATVLPVHGVVQLGSNAGRTALMWKHVSPRITVLFVAGAVVGVAVAAWIFVGLSTETLQLLLALFILFSLWTPKFKPSNLPEPGFVVVGAVATFCTMFVGATGPLVATFMSTERLQRHGVVATAAACLSSQHVLKIVAFGILGFHFLPWVPLLAAMIASGFLGTLTGRRVLDHIPERIFAQLFRVVISLLALRLLWVALS